MILIEATFNNWIDLFPFLMAYQLSWVNDKPIPAEKKVE